MLIDTSPDMRDQLLDAGVGELDAVVYTHSHADHVARHRRPAPDRLQHAPPPAGLGRRRRRKRRSHARFGYAFVQPAGLALSADPRHAHDRRARSRSTARAGRSTLTPLPGRSRLDGRAGLPHRRPRLPARRGRTSRRRPGARCRASTAGSSTRCAARRTRPMPISRRRWTGSRGPRPARAVLTNMHIDLDYATRRGRAAAACHARLRRA